jgi:hypothetical protein
VFDELGADVDVRRYEGMGHTVNADELAAVSGLIERTPKGWTELSGRLDELSRRVRGR